MRRCSLFFALLSLGCFEDPADGGELGEGSTSAAGSGSTQSTVDSTTSGSGTGSSSSSETSLGTSTTAADGSSSTAGPSCGDGNIDVGEDCDDGNTVEGDLCNNDCRESGTVLWVETIPNVLGTNTNTLNAVVVLEDGQILAGGERFIAAEEGFQSEANVVRFSPDGVLELDVDLVTTERNDSVRGLEVDAQGSIYAVGEQDSVAGIRSTAWIGEIDADGSLVGELVTSSMGELSGYRAVATGPDLVMAVGFRSEGASVTTHVASYSPALVPGQTDDSVGSDPPEATSHVRDVVMDAHGTYVAGYRTDGPTFRGFTTTSPVDGVAYTPEDEANNTYTWGLAIAEPGNGSSSLWSVGWNDGTDFPLIAQLHRIGRDGALEETVMGYLGEQGEGAFYTSIVVDPSGDLIVAGGSLIGDIPNQFLPLVRRLDPAGEERWTRVFNDMDSLRGGISGLALDVDGTIVVCGNATDGRNERRQLVAKLRP